MFVVAALVALALGALPAPADAAHARRCGSIYNVVGERDYRVFATGVACRTAKRWSATYLKRRRSPVGFRCSRVRQRGVKQVFFCRGTRNRSFYAERR